MRVFPIGFLLRALLCVVMAARPWEVLCAASVQQDYEKVPVLHAADLLGARFLSGKKFSVRDKVQNIDGANHFRIDSSFGSFEAVGNQQLLQRVREIEALEQMHELSRGAEFSKALGRSASSPLVAVKDLVLHPAQTLGGLPRGVWKFLRRAGRAVEEGGQGRKASEYEDGAGRALIGFSRVKRGLALRVGVDPYTSNKVLQKELDRMAWTMFAGEMPLRLGSIAVTGGVGVALVSTELSSELNQVLLDSSPIDLRIRNAKKLKAMGVPDGDATALVNSAAFSPLHQTVIVAALEKLEGVKGREVVVRMAAGAEKEAAAVRFQQLALLLVRLKEDGRRSPVQLGMFRGRMVYGAVDGSYVAPLVCDYAVWTREMEELVRALKQASATGKRAGVVFTGVASAKCRQRLLEEKVDFVERALPGPW